MQPQHQHRITLINCSNEAGEQSVKYNKRYGVEDLKKWGYEDKKKKHTLNYSAHIIPISQSC